MRSIVSELLPPPLSSTLIWSWPTSTLITGGTPAPSHASSALSIKPIDPTSAHWYDLSALKT